MPRQTAAVKQRRGKPGGKQAKRKYYVSGRDPFKPEVGRAPEVILLEQVSVRCIGYHDRAQRTDESTEQDSECDEALRINAKGYKKAHQSAYQSADKTAYGQRAPTRHGRGGRSKACGAAKAQRINVSQLVTPQILHLDSSNGEGDAGDKNVKKAQQHTLSEEYILLQEALSQVGVIQRRGCSAVEQA